MELPTIQKGQRKLVKIQEGQVFLLPSRIPHSPQRPEKGSIGLVIERERSGEELDCLRYYVDFQECKEVLWEKYFPCYDLGRDLVPQVKVFFFCLFLSFLFFLFFFFSFLFSFLYSFSLSLPLSHSPQGLLCLRRIQNQKTHSH